MIDFNIYYQNDFQRRLMLKMGSKYYPEYELIYSTRYAVDFIKDRQNQNGSNTISFKEFIKHTRNKIEESSRRKDSVVE